MSEADPQITALYNWEGSNGWDSNRTSFKKARAAILSACRHFWVEPPEIRLHKTRSLPWSKPGQMLISLQRDRYLNIPIALHEATHHIVFHLFGDKPQDHGPTFLGIYLHLLERAKVKTRANLRASARAYGLKWREDIKE